MFTEDTEDCSGKNSFWFLVAGIKNNPYASVVKINLGFISPWSLCLLCVLRGLL